MVVAPYFLVLYKCRHVTVEPSQPPTFSFKLLFSLLIMADSSSESSEYLPSESGRGGGAMASAVVPLAGQSQWELKGGGWTNGNPKKKIESRETAPTRPSRAAVAFGMLAELFGFDFLYKLQHLITCREDNYCLRPKPRPRPRRPSPVQCPSNPSGVLNGSWLLECPGGF